MLIYNKKGKPSWLPFFIDYIYGKLKIMENCLFSKRNVAIDMLRGLTMLLMVFVNDMWTVGDVPHFLEHFDTREDGMGVADLVFPMFLFAMGMSIPYAIERRFSKGFSGESTLGHILSRTLALLLMGVFIVNSEGRFESTLGYGLPFYRIAMVIAFFLIWNAYPAGAKHKKWLQASGIAILLFLAFTFRNPRGGYFTAGWWGILGLIGWAYCFCAVAYLLARKKPQYLIIIWIALMLVNMLHTGMRDGGNLLEGRTFISDMAGVLRLGNGSGTIMATGGMLLSLAERRLYGRTAPVRIACALAASVLLAAIAAVAHNWWIISKNLGTLPWCLYVSSISVALYAFLRVLEAYGKTGWFRPLSPSGTATLTVYMMPYLLYSISAIIGLHTPHGLDGALGLLKCALFSLVCVFCAGLLGKIRIKLSV